MTDFNLDFALMIFLAVAVPALGSLLVYLAARAFAALAGGFIE